MTPEEIEHKMRQLKVFDAITRERERQDIKWGVQDHDPFTWIAVLTEEVGEFSQAALHLKYGGKKAKGFREEAIQMAAVATAIIECIDRGTWQWPKVKKSKKISSKAKRKRA